MILSGGGGLRGFLVTFIRLAGMLFNIALLARIFISYMPQFRDSRFYEIVFAITEPVLGPIRRLMPSMMGLDFSPMVAMLLVSVVQRVLYQLAYLF